MYQRADQPVVLKGAEAARAFFAPNMACARPGDWWIAHVDEQVRCIHLQHHRAEPADASAIPVEAIMGEAEQLNSAGILLARHAVEEPWPGGSATVAQLRGLLRVSEALDLTVIDLLTFSAQGCSSMRRGALL